VSGEPAAAGGSRAERLLALKRRFAEGAAEDVREVRALLAGGAAAPDGDPARRLRKLVHDLRGSGGAYGFPAITAAAAAIEDELLAGRAPAEATVERLGAAVLDAARDVKPGAPGGGPA